MGKAYDTPQTPPVTAVPATLTNGEGRPITEFVDGKPIDPSTGRLMQQAPTAPGAANSPAWTSQLQMPGQPGTVPELTSPVPAQVAPAPATVNAPITLGSTPPGVAAVVLPAIPAALPAATGKCITEGCNCKVKDHGMCARCLKDTIEYMKSDPNVTWGFLEANGLALPASSTTSGNKFRAGLAAKLTALHAGSARQDKTS